jgi:LmbE family N-acetylglucosaminyl deacetylase
MTAHLYLSPHLDDAVLSCGPLIHMQTRSGERVIVFTVCAGDAPASGLSPFAESLHTRWQTPANAVAARRAEDIAALHVLGARHLHLSVPDCIYRRHPVDGAPHSGEREAQAEFAPAPLYASEAALFGEWHPAEHGLARQVAQSISDLRLIVRATHLYAPLGIGRHVDHQLTRRAAELIGLPLLYYEDYPYAARTSDTNAWGGLAHGLREEWRAFDEAALEAQCRAIVAYQSQLSTFWADEAVMRADLRDFANRSGAGLAVRLWQAG